MAKRARRRKGIRGGARWRKIAERAAEHYAVHVMQCVKTYRVHAAPWNRTDIFGADVLGKQASGDAVYIQVTTSPRVHRKKAALTEIPWSPCDVVVILQLVLQRESRNVVPYFRRYDMNVATHDWTMASELFPVPDEWLKGRKRKDRRDVHFTENGTDGCEC